jgi:hypothetical protein
MGLTFYLSAFTGGRAPAPNLAMDYTAACIETIPDDITAYGHLTRVGRIPRRFIQL